MRLGETHGGSHAVFSPDWLNHHHAEGQRRSRRRTAAPPDAGLPPTQVVTEDQPHPTRELGGAAARFEPRSSSPAVPSTRPKQRSTAVANGHSGRLAVGAELRHRLSVIACRWAAGQSFPSSRWHERPGPRWVRTAPGAAGPRWARAVTVGVKGSQVTGGLPLQPQTAKQHGIGFEPLSLRHDIGSPTCGFAQGTTRGSP
jgi:hypothetical protein